MPREFFNDQELESTRKALSLLIGELESTRKALTLLIGDLETMKARLHDFSKSRMRTRLEGVQRDLGSVIESLPTETPSGVDTQPQEKTDGLPT